MLGQEILQLASSEEVVYFRTTVSRSVDGSHGYEQKSGTAFRKATGEPVDSWELLSCPPEEALEKMMDKEGIKDEKLRSEMKAAFCPEDMLFYPNRLEIYFQQGTLPSQEHSYIMAADYDEGLAEILYEWAIPKKS